MLTTKKMTLTYKKIDVLTIEYFFKHATVKKMTMTYKKKKIFKQLTISLIMQTEQ